MGKGGTIYIYICIFTNISIYIYIYTYIHIYIYTYIHIWYAHVTHNTSECTDMRTHILLYISIYGQFTYMWHTNMTSRKLV